MFHFVHWYLFIEESSYSRIIFLYRVWNFMRQQTCQNSVRQFNTWFYRLACIASGLSQFSAKSDLKMEKAKSKSGIRTRSRKDFTKQKPFQQPYRPFCASFTTTMNLNRASQLTMLKSRESVAVGRSPSSLLYFWQSENRKISANLSRSWPPTFHCKTMYVRLSLLEDIQRLTKQQTQ
jgi:hypothetical protein